ncbi:hypothetical protein WLQ65_18680 [Pseudoalteromonas piscicida]|uniref:hypothetical protein n=1 Tax=Pseudoalteromonas piscicida TaxID=43662 RepID=UPI0030C97B7C
MRRLSRYAPYIAFCLSLNVNAAVPDSSKMAHWFNQPVALNGWQLTHQAEQFTLTPKSQSEAHGEVFYKPKHWPCVVSVPHRFHDKHTLTIGEHIFQHSCQVLLNNTKHRYDGNDTAKTYDYAKQLHNIHTSAVVGFTSLHPTAKVFQIHGFSQKKRKTDAGKLSEIILSQGKTNDDSLWKLKSCLVKQGYRALIYPQEVQELGGTQNIMHQLALPEYSFIHIELSYQTRKQLINNNQQLEQFTKCVQSLL